MRVYQFRHLGKQRLEYREGQDLSSFFEEFGAGGFGFFFGEQPEPRRADDVSLQHARLDLPALFFGVFEHVERGFLRLGVLVEVVVDLLRRGGDVEPCGRPGAQGGGEGGGERLAEGGRQKLLP